jgi:hypothetical protein
MHNPTTNLCRRSLATDAHSRIVFATNPMGARRPNIGSSKQLRFNYLRAVFLLKRRAWDSKYCFSQAPHARAFSAISDAMPTI